jgi:hypothetical protein
MYGTFGGKNAGNQLFFAAVYLLHELRLCQYQKQMKYSIYFWVWEEMLLEEPHCHEHDGQHLSDFLETYKQGDILGAP